ncbi:MAG: leucine--tRNA ligase [Firmicutes bacterium]|nr:leucine--tRNA ligase [Bacillota bacterium]
MILREYDPKQIEKKWQRIWEEKGAFHASDRTDKPKFYALIEFPYPSGAGLHVGHPRPYTALDIVARKRRMQGYNVLYPIGWDAFGLPTENFAIKNKIHPRVVTERNVAHFKEQMQSIGFSFDWSREVNTTDPAYYKWTQWIFLQMFKKDLAYKRMMAVNWCTQCKVGLANEEVVNGVCERCGGKVERRMRSQWMLAITKYADRLIDDLDDVDYIERVKVQQKNWIGRSEGAEVDFTVNGRKMTIYTTRPDTMFGVTYMVMSPEHPYLDEWKDQIRNWDDVADYRKKSSEKSDFERTELAKDKTGVKLEGIMAVNPVNGAEIPVFISDYVLMSYGTGAIMAVPGHDTRDWEFARKFHLPIIEVVAGGDIEKEAFVDIETGTLVNSGFLNGLSVEEAKKAITEWLTEKGLGHKKINFKLRDWVFSRQRYWGEPIPIVHCEKCGMVPLPESELPLLLPDVDSYEPGPNGESPLAAMTDWVNTTCPQCGGPALRETDTMPQWAGSSWYFLRYMDPHNDQALASKEALDYWSPVDWYNGGMEHTTLHLLYSRFWHKFLYDIGVVPTKEPYAKRTSHGMILGQNPHYVGNFETQAEKDAMIEKYGADALRPAVKMSKSLGNVVNPDEVIDTYGADTLRMYEMFIGDFEKAAPWSDKSVNGVRRFLDRVWKLQEMMTADEGISADMETPLHQTIKKVSQDDESLKFNTAIAAMMSLVNKFYAKGSITRGEMSVLIRLLNPDAPHITEEMWENCGFGGYVYEQSWPEWDEEKTVEAMITIAVQINGKSKGTLQVAKDADKDAVMEVFRADQRLMTQIEGKQVVKEIYVPGRIVNVVVR